MKTPKRLLPLQEEGLIDEVLVQLKSGKEATVYLVRCGDEIRAAKMYKDAAQRSFKQAAVYLEGRKTRNSRDARAMARGSKFGKRVTEEGWQNAEVDALYRLDAAGVRVPKPYGCFDDVLLMELVTDDEGDAAPRLCELVFSPEEAVELHHELIQEVVRMLCAGVVHGDLSEYNILMDPYGPVIIDLPQAINAASNPHAEMMLMRDVQNLADFFGQFAPELNKTRYGLEIWHLYEAGELTPDSVLTGEAEEDLHEADLVSVLREIEDARLEEEARLARINATDDDSE
ncbi:PA4780 family RIO1-like protein kinase [Alcanivorax sp. 1008]|uniref:PA4780 family RIO1-like protein kinase n=1 Tax=Alcanivorax sp. 1008 TaxID=2816853 RepID=UPI001DD7FCA2|nr:serine protein kinase RIO [Alcanivorax sp. 1008]